MNTSVKRRRFRCAIELFDVLYWGACVFLLLIVLLLSGCTTTSRTRVSPASTNATHETRTERAGRTKTKTLKLEIQPGSIEEPEPKPTSEDAPVSADFVVGLVGMPPIHGGISGGEGAASPSLLPVGFRPGESASQHVDPSIAEAIEQAVRDRSSVRFEYTETEEVPLTADTTASSLDDNGPGLQTSSDEAAIGFDGRKSGADLPWGGTSGKTTWGIDASLLSRGVNALHIVGAIVMVGAIIPVLIPPRRWVASGIVLLVGLLIIAAGTVSEQAPWVFVLAILGLLGVAGWLGYEAWRNKRRGVALESIVKGVESTNQPVVKKSIGDAAGDQLAIVKNETNAVKAKLKLRKT